MLFDFKLGFGFMRLPIISDNPSDIDYEKVNKLVDYFIEKARVILILAFITITGKANMPLKNVS